jgi:hypothetical protein
MKHSLNVNEALPPLLRGLGTTVILVATVVSLATARGNQRPPTSLRLPLARPAAAASSQGAPPATRDLDLAREIAALRQEVADDSVLEEVFENPWFELCGIVGTAVITSSFFLEWSIRRRKLAQGAGASAPG